MQDDHIPAQGEPAAASSFPGASAPGDCGQGRSWRGLLVAAGLLCVGLATAGIFLPLLPTTPFLLLAAACFARSSPRLHHWLHANRWFGPYLMAYRRGEGIPLRAKCVTLFLLWVTLGSSIALAVPPRLWWVRCLLALIGLAVTVHILRLKTRRQSS